MDSLLLSTMQLTMPKSNYTLRAMYRFVIINIIVKTFFTCTHSPNPYFQYLSIYAIAVQFQFKNFIEVKRTDKSLKYNSIWIGNLAPLSEVSLTHSFRISMTTSLNKCASQYIVLVWLCCLGVLWLKWRLAYISY